MRKKLLLLMLAFIGIITMTNAYHDARMNAATSWLSLNTLSVGDKVVVGNYGGKEVIWDIGAIGSGDYTLMMSTGLGIYPMCSDTTESAGFDSSLGKSYCNFMTTNPSYTNSPIYDATNDFQSAFSSFEKKKLTSTSFSAGSFPYAFVPRGSDFKDYLNIQNILAEAAYQPDDCYWLADYGRSSDDLFDPSKNKYNLIVYGKMLTSSLTMKTRYPHDDVNAVKVDLEDDGRVIIYHYDQAIIDRTKQRIQDLVREVEKDKIYTGKVVKVEDFGCFVELWPGCEGLVHVSHLSKERVEKASDVVKVGDEIVVKSLGFDKKGRLNLSRKEVMK